MRRNSTSALVDVHMCSPCQVPQEDQPSLTGREGFCIIHSPRSIWLSILCFLLAMMLTGYSLVSDRYADMSTMRVSTEDPEAIIVSGTISQQRAAVLANFVKYGNSAGESASRVR